MSTDSLNDISAISAMIGYCQSLKAGMVITHEYIDRMNSYYVPKLQEVADRIKMSEISDNGSGKAVIKSSGQEELGTVREAAGLEPRCDQPAPATQQPVGKSEVEDEAILNTLGDLKEPWDRLLPYVNATPELLSLLYDLDLMPEQIHVRRNFVRMMQLAEWHKHYAPKRELNALAEIKAILLQGVDLVGGYSCLHPTMQLAINRINQIEGDKSNE